MKKVIAVAAAACGMFVLVTPNAVASGESLPTAVVAVLDRLATTGQLSDADREVLKGYPDIATQVVDPAKVTESGSTVAVDPVVSPAAEMGAMARDCWISNRTVTGYSALGFEVYKFHHQVDWCADGSRVLGMHFRNGWATELEGTMYWRGLTQNVASPTPNWDATSFYQAAIENCILKYGCIRTNYPWSRLTLRGNSTVSYEWGH